ncbi:class I SAM-dependent methyltransferase [Nocardiopsis rhodophaea]|uniref:class I SAM-dependent methyltransferase n=1 Tax=Nocardiopsis rhodophaea TaxID=280238 RepID=UPI0031D6607A
MDGTAEGNGDVGAGGAIYDYGDIYDLIYKGGGKDYGFEASTVAHHIRKRNPGADSVLDVGCGTGGHLGYLANEFSHVEGIDYTEGMLAECRKNLPEIPVHMADMRDFRLERRFDAVVSLFNVVGNVADRDELDATLASFTRHLVAGGVIVVEPWWFEENFTPDHIGSSLTTFGDTTVARVSHSVREGRTTRMDVHCVIGEPGKGVRHFSYEHVMALFRQEDYEAAFTRAGCSVEYIEGAYPGPGLFVGVRRGRGGRVMGSDALRTHGSSTGRR